VKKSSPRESFFGKGCLALSAAPKLVMMTRERETFNGWVDDHL
jgi:hypothetical protein